MKTLSIIMKQIFKPLIILFALGILIGVMENPVFAGTKILRTGNKLKSTVNITSIKIHRDQANTKVTVNGGGWTTAPPGTKQDVVLRATGGGIPPGGTVDVNLTRDGGAVPGGRIIGWDDAAGNWYGRCPDPVSYRVVDGSDTGTDYLGYSIPAHQWGYFYQVWNTEDFVGKSKTTMIKIGINSEAYNFQILNNSFEIHPVPGFDLRDIERPLNEEDTYWGMNYMEPGDALGVPGDVDMTWSFNPSTGIATLTYLPDLPEDGMGPGQTSSLVGFTCADAPHFTEGENIATLWVTGGRCPKCHDTNPENFVPVPEPATVVLLALGGLALLRRRRKA